MSHHFKKHDRGFTLTELMVSVGIVSVILTVIVLGQSTYNDRSSLSILADNISLSVAETQAYGIAVKELTPGSSDFSAAYGMAFSLLNSGSPTAYILFADRNGDGVYNGDWSCPTGGSSECLEKVNIVRGNYIHDFCVDRTLGSDQCSAVKRVDISFRRPETEARLTFFNSSGSLYNVENTQGIRIYLRSPGAAEKIVTVFTTGQIGIQ